LVEVDIGITPEKLKEFGFKPEIQELARDVVGTTQKGPTGFPKPVWHYRLILEEPNRSIEDVYFWILEHFRSSQGYSDIIKISDIFSAAEQSSFFGSIQQRIGLQQDKVSQFLATIGKMVKELFQLVRELRILDERLGYYKDSMDRDSPSMESADITLKSIWVDLVEQAGKNPASVYGLAKELGFTPLPDLFYSTHPITPKDVDAKVDNMKEFNTKLREVLKRKLRQYIDWRNSTYSEVKNRRIFTVKYLRQHFDIIRMYMNWVKPYLRNIRRMQLADRSKSPDLISAFEGSMVELEFLAKKLPRTKGESQVMKYNKRFYSVSVVHFAYRTIPQMNYHSEYQRGPLHVGQVDMQLRAYAWDQKMIENYVKMRQSDDIELIASIDGSVKAAMESLGDELERYLREAGEDIRFNKQEEEQKKPKGPSLLEPFAAVGKGFGDIGKLFIKSPLSAFKSDRMSYPDEVEQKIAGDDAQASIWQTYKNFKKMVRMLAW
jgi:hypothetical protein